MICNITQGIIPKYLEILKSKNRKQSLKKYIVKSGAGDLEGQKKGKVIKFGWIEGVYVSTLFIRQGYF